MEVDPLVMKALHHLVSRKPDSTEKLKKMLFESLGREYVPAQAESAPAKIKRTKSQDSADSADEDADMGAETDCSTDVGGGKNEDTMDADDFAFDMGISCVICRQFDVSSNNQLLECNECHSLYHQLCHKPAISEGQDDKFICHKCASPKKSSEAKMKSSKTEDGSSKKGSSDSFKKSDSSKSEKSADSKKHSETGKDKKSKSDKKSKDKSSDKSSKDKLGNKNKVDSDKEKEKSKKHKSDSKSDSKSEGAVTVKKEKDSSKSDSASVKNKLKEKVTSGSGSGSEKSHKSSPSGSGSESKHKRSGADGGEKEKKLKKIKREKADIYPAD